MSYFNKSTKKWTTVSVPWWSYGEPEILYAGDGVFLAKIVGMANSDRNNFSSLINQVSYYTEYIKNRDNWKFAGIYYDIGKSGANIDKRPAIKRMIRHC
jgi:hypothetical protein